jgi:hypothetical protein
VILGLNFLINGRIAGHHEELHEIGVEAPEERHNSLYNLAAIV